MTQRGSTSGKMPANLRVTLIWPGSEVHQAADEQSRGSAGENYRRAQKKAPGKELSQGGRGQHPYPGAIGRLPHRRCKCGGSQMSRSVQLTSLSTEQRFAVRRIN